MKTIPLGWQVAAWPLALALALPSGTAPLGSLPWVAGVAFAPILTYMVRGSTTPSSWGLLGWLGGSIHYGIHVAWLPHVLALGGFAWWHQGLVLALVVIALGAPWGLVLGASAWLHRGAHFRLPFGGFFRAVRVVSCPVSRPIFCHFTCHALLAFPLLLTLHALVLGSAPWQGVPWGSVASSQWQSLLGGWLAPLLGSAGIAFVLGCLNSAWAWWWLHRTTAGNPTFDATKPLALHSSIIPHPNPIALRWVGVGLCLLSFGGAWSRALPFPFAVQHQSPPTSLPRPTQRQFDAILLNVHQPLTGNSPLVRQRLRSLMAHTATGVLALEKALPAPFPPTGLPSPRPVLAIWPESAAGGDAERGRVLVDVAAFGRAVGVDVLLGSHARRHGQRFNSALLVKHTPFDIVRYDKTQLVPFGEYTPRGWGWLLGRTVSAGTEGYQPGIRPPVLAWAGGVLGVAICLEGMLPWRLRKTVAAGAQALVITSNHAWLPPWAKHQQFALAALASLQVGRNALLVSNAGFTGLIQAGLPTRFAAPIISSSPFQRTTPLNTHPQVNVLPVRVTWQHHRTPWVRWGAWPLLGLCTLLFCLAKPFSLVIAHVDEP